MGGPRAAVHPGALRCTIVIASTSPLRHLVVPASPRRRSSSPRRLRRVVVPTASPSSAGSPPPLLCASLTAVSPLARHRSPAHHVMPCVNQRLAHTSAPNPDTRRGNGPRIEISLLPDDQQHCWAGGRVSLLALRLAVYSRRRSVSCFCCASRHCPATIGTRWKGLDGSIHDR